MNALTGIDPRDSRIANLTEQVAYLRRELGLARDRDFEARLAITYGLSRQEAQLLSVLAQRRNVTVSKETLMDALYGHRQEEPEIKIIDVFVCKLRKKTGAGMVTTMWGRGYVVTPLGLAACDAIRRGETPEPIPTPPARTPVERVQRQQQATTGMLTWMVANGPASASQIAAGAKVDPPHYVHSYLQQHKKHARVEKVSRPIFRGEGKVEGGAWRVTDAGTAWLAHLVGNDGQ